MNNNLNKDEKILSNEIDYILTKYINKRFKNYRGLRLVINVKNKSYCSFKLYHDTSPMIRGEYKNNKLTITEVFEYYIFNVSKINYNKLMDINAFEELINNSFNFLDINLMFYDINKYDEFDHNVQTSFEFSKDNYKKKLKKLKMEVKIRGGK